MTSPVFVFSKTRPGETSNLDPQPTLGFGNLSILSPDKYGLQYELIEYENWYFDFIQKYKAAFEENGATDIQLFIEIFHDGGQLNFEIFSRELLLKVAEYKIAIPISYYFVTTAQLIELIQETNISKESAEEYIRQG